MPAPYPQEFREDLVRVARSREDGITIAQIAKDFGVHEIRGENRWKGWVGRAAGAGDQSFLQSDW